MGRIKYTELPLKEGEFLDEYNHKYSQIEGGDVVVMKYCPHCREWHPLTNFYKLNSTKDGLQSWCKTCNKGRRKETKAPSPIEFTSKTETINEDNEQQTELSLDSMLEIIKEREREKDEEISKLKEENHALKNNQFDLNKLTERDIEKYLQSNEIPLRILFEAIARRETRYAFFAIDKVAGMKIPICLEHTVG